MFLNGIIYDIDSLHSVTYPEATMLDIVYEQRFKALAKGQS